MQVRQYTVAAWCDKVSYTQTQVEAESAEQALELARSRKVEGEVTDDRLPWEKPEPPGVVTIEIEGGCLVDVAGLPPGYVYELIDHDNKE